MIEVTDVGFDVGGGVIISYVDTAVDIRDDAQVMRRQSFRIESQQFADGIDLLRRAARNLVTDVLAVWEALPITAPETTAGEPNDRPGSDEEDVDEALVRRQHEQLERARGR